MAAGERKRKFMKTNGKGKRNKGVRSKVKEVKEIKRKEIVKEKIKNKRKRKRKT